MPNYFFKPFTQKEFSQLRLLLDKLQMQFDDSQNAFEFERIDETLDDIHQDNLQDDD